MDLAADNSSKVETTACKESNYEYGTIDCPCA